MNSPEIYSKKCFSHLIFHINRRMSIAIFLQPIDDLMGNKMKEYFYRKGVSTFIYRIDSIFIKRNSGNDIKLL